MQIESTESVFLHAFSLQIFSKHLVVDNYWPSYV